MLLLKVDAAGSRQDDDPARHHRLHRPHLPLLFLELMGRRVAGGLLGSGAGALTIIAGYTTIRRGWPMSAFWLLLAGRSSFRADGGLRHRRALCGGGLAIAYLRDNRHGLWPTASAASARSSGRSASR